ncbi:MAG: hypothetical protein ACSHX6_02595 [Akkermansiaceae bacterium]
MNPYTSPESDQNSEKKPVNTELRNIVIGWERMRILYNIILFLVGIVAIFFSMRAPYFSLEETVLSSIVFGIFANLCFCAGPTVETYVRVIFNYQDVKTLRIGLFILGTLLSLVPAFLVIISVDFLLLF